MVTCLCQGVRMNDSSSGICVFHSISSVKSDICCFFETQGDRVIRNDSFAALLDVFSAETRPILAFLCSFS